MKRPAIEQQHLPGQEPKKDPKVHKRALDYVRKRDARIAANALEKDSHGDLLTAMIEAGMEVYEYGDLRVVVNNARKCRVESVKDSESNGDDAKDD